MEDDKLKKLFENYNPGLSSDFRFMDRLTRSLDTVEIVKQRNAMLRRRSRMAVVIAAIAGLITGSVATLIMPLLTAWLSNVHFSVRSISFSIPVESCDIAGWAIAATISVIAAANAYEIAMSRMKAG